MRYSGGKGLTGLKLAPEVLRISHNRIIEPFCGALSMTVHLQPYIASDASKPIITLVEAIRKGWEPPIEISEQLYKECQNNKNNTDDPLIAFVGHCTFGGKWYGGLARSHKRQREPVRAAANAIIKRVKTCPNTIFKHIDYRETDITLGDLVYCDPPYKGTTNGYAVSGFNHIEFWDWARKCSEIATVVVSEYVAPEDFEAIFTLDCPTSLKHKYTERRLEKLFIYRGEL